MAGITFPLRLIIPFTKSDVPATEVIGMVPMLSFILRISYAVALTGKAERKRPFFPATNRLFQRIDCFCHCIYFFYLLYLLKKFDNVI